MPNYNKVILVGHVTRTPEERTYADNKVMVRFGLAINENWGKEKKTHFVDCIAFGKTAEVIASYVAKGHPLFVEGKLNYSTWDDRDSGKKRSKLEVMVNSIEFLKTSEAKAKQASPEEEFGEIPF